MLNIHDLERRWLKYKIKSYSPLLFSSVAITILLGFSIVYFFSQEQAQEDVATKVPEPVKTTPLVQEHNNTPPVMQAKVTQAPIEVPQNTTEVKQPVNEETLVLKPSLRFMDNIEDGLNNYYVSDETIQTNDYDQQRRHQQINTIPQDTIIEQNTKEETKQNLSIIRHKDKTDLSDVIRRFKKNKNPTLSLFIAKKYYKMGEYQKSYNYALMTNEINKDIEESWLIFAKSLVKLGQHELAMATLKSYLKSKDSTSAKTLLNKIETGEFR
jgi:tetratricopeptide (TPR) repeat protein